MLNIKTITNQNKWDGYVESFPQVSFLQSWNWGQFIKEKGGDAFYWQFEDNGDEVGASLVTLQKSSRGNYLECIGGPLFPTHETSGQIVDDYFNSWLDGVKKLAHETGAGFLRLRLPVKDTAESREFLDHYNFRETKLYYQAELTRLVDLNRTEKELLSEMKKNTRYEMRRAEREGVVIEKISNIKKQKEKDNAFQTFLDLYKQMVDRQDFVGYTESYLKKQFDLFNENDQASLYIAYFEDKPVAASIFFHYGDTITYHHSASIPFSKFSAPSLILWEAMKDAKEQGKCWFDLFGIAPPGKRYESRIGLTKFKEGFGGEEWHWARTHDLIYSMPKYYFSLLIEQIPSGVREMGARVVKMVGKFIS